MNSHRSDLIPDDLSAPFVRKVSDTIESYGMIAPGDRVITAVSGGADSMALLCVFNTISRIKNFNFTVAHVNHGIRGDEADRDENFVRDFCEKRAIPFVCAHFDVPAIANASGESTEMCGRRLRYSFFEQIDPDAKIATAHNLNDCEETFFLNLARGATLKGLTGIPPVRGKVIRPLIECSRSQIEAYLNNVGVTFVTDSTNLSDDYSRNKVRHSVIPVLKSLNPDFDDTFRNCVRSLKSENSYLDLLTDEALSEAKDGDRFICDKIFTLPEALRNRALIKVFEFYGCRAPEAKHIGILCENGSVNLPGDITVFSAYGYLQKRSELTSPAGTEFLPVELAEIAGFSLRELSNLGYADADALKGSFVRTRCDGDRFLPAGGQHSRSLKSMFAANKVPPEQRANAVIIEKDGNILYVQGIGTSAFAVPGKNTKEAVRIITNADRRL